MNPTDGTQFKKHILKDTKDSFGDGAKLESCDIFEGKTNKTIIRLQL